MGTYVQSRCTLKPHTSLCWGNDFDTLLHKNLYHYVVILLERINLVRRGRASVTDILLVATRKIPRPRLAVAACSPRHRCDFRIPPAKRAGASLLSADKICALRALFYFAEREGFEPSRQFYPPGTLAPCCLRPLGHLSYVEIQYHKIDVSHMPLNGVIPLSSVYMLSR